MFVVVPELKLLVVSEPKVVMSISVPLNILVILPLQMRKVLAKVLKATYLNSIVGLSIGNLQSKSVLLCL